MMPAKMVTTSLLKTMVFWNKDNDVIIPTHDVTNKILSLNSNYVTMWTKFGKSSISMREVIIASVL